MASTLDPEELIVCPYDPVHRLRRKRMPYHIMKCRKNFNPKDFKHCPFNARHVVPGPEFDYHVRHCPDMAILDARMLHMQQQNNDVFLKGCTDLPPQNADYVVPDSSESWEADNVVYVPPSQVGLFTSGSTDPTGRPPAVPRQPPLAQIPVEEPPKPRLPQNTGNAELEVVQYSLSSSQPPKPQGRGRGRGRAVRTTLSPPGGLQQTIQPKSASVVDPNPPTTTAPTVRDSNSDDMSSVVSEKDELYKIKRKLGKMLKQIVKIEEIQASGVAVNADQLAKLARKGDVIAQLEKLT